MKMLPKAVGGHRPIMLFRSLFRVVGKARAREVKLWFKELTKAYPEINMAPRRWGSDATYRCQTRRDLGLELGEDGMGAEECECQWGLRTGFDRVGWEKLQELAGLWRYPAGPLRLSAYESFMAAKTCDGRIDWAQTFPETWHGSRQPLCPMRDLLDDDARYHEGPAGGNWSSTQHPLG